MVHFADEKAIEKHGWPQETLVIDELYFLNTSSKKRRPRPPTVSPHQMGSPLSRVENAPNKAPARPFHLNIGDPYGTIRFVSASSRIDSPSFTSVHAGQFSTVRPGTAIRSQPALTTVQLPSVQLSRFGCRFAAWACLCASIRRRVRMPVSRR